MYYIMYSGEDGIDIKECENIDEVKECIDPEEGDYGPVKFLDKLPKIVDGNFWTDEESIVIIKGKIIVPKPKKVIETYDIE